ncbi:hypothetical protein [Sphingomonas sp. PR090111-T3T-6A]|uniref:hypothetical protein n=1 Tax=Sphingomonas sp. PR090111-T3T-6A TaxID=685778 RepID=UPI000381FC06|nr:hypothetical protein [Sphingomonas sp. PR090111-T3T-6A]
MSPLLRTLVLLVAAPILGFALYLGLTWTPLFENVHILFYRGLLLCGLSAVLLGVFLAVAGRWRPIEPIAIIAAAALSLSANLMFLIVLPVTIDRSISVFLLAEIDAHQASPLTTRQLEAAFVQHYVHDMRQIDRRVAEQTISGTISAEDGKIRLTPRGQRFLRLARFLAEPFRTDPRFVGLAPPADQVVK